MDVPVANPTHRVARFYDWLESIPPHPPFHTRPEFRFYADLTDDEVDAAQAEMRRRGEALQREAETLSAEAAKRAAATGGLQ